jgi:monoamine oxidase
VDDVLDLAVVGAGAAGTYVSYHVQRERPDWSIALFERTDRVGGRLRSLTVAGLDHPIELGGMRFLTSHRRVADTVARFELATHPFDATGGAERSFLRGRFGAGAGDPWAGAGYDLPAGERGRSAVDLLVSAFEQIVPGASSLTAADWERVRGEGGHKGRPLTDWSIAEALSSVLSPEGHRFVTDAFGYDSGLRVQNAGNAIEYLLGGGDPSAVARVPDDGMHAIPQALATGFERSGGQVRLGHQLEAVDSSGGLLSLRFSSGPVLPARRVVLALPVPSLGGVADASPVLDASIRAILGSVEPFPAMKLYLWYDRPWWRDGGAVIRLTTDLPPRKLFYFGDDPDGPATLLASYTDGLHTQPWHELVTGKGSAGSPAPGQLIDIATGYLAEIHPGVDPIPAPSGSAFSFWGADPLETGWHFWRPGYRSDDVIAATLRPIEGVQVFVCGEAFSHAQGWVEGALESAHAVVERLVQP